MRKNISIIISICALLIAIRLFENKLFYILLDFRGSLGEDSLLLLFLSLLCPFLLLSSLPLALPPPLAPVSQSANPAVFWMCSFRDFSKGWEGATKLGFTGWRCSWKRTHILQQKGDENECIELHNAEEEAENKGWKKHLSILWELR